MYALDAAWSQVKEKKKEKIFAKELEGIVVKEDHSQSQTISLLPFVKNTSWLEGSNSPSFIYSSSIYTS